MADLGFGFWTSLLYSPYDARLWRGANDYQMLRDRFSNTPRHVQRCERISERYDRVRLLRNRVFHHEPIWYYDDFQRRHAEILESIGWISPVLLNTTALFDRFPLVYRLGRQRIEAAVTFHLGIP